MNAKTIVTLGLKIIALTIILLLCSAVAASISGLAALPAAGELPSGSTQPSDAMAGATALLVVSGLQAIALSYPIIRSRWTGWRLVVTTALVHYGVMTFLSQIETVVFLNYLVDVVPTELLPYMFLDGAIVAVLFAPLAVLVLGKMRKSNGIQKPNQRLIMPWTQWVWRLALVAVAYLVIYLSFGALVFMPLAGNAFQDYYGDLQMPVWILPFQMVRALIWAALALPVIRMMKGNRWEAGLAVGLLFGVLMGGLLLLPNEFMPEAIRRAHFIEVASSNFLFGWIVVWLLTQRRASQENQ